MLKLRSIGLTTIRCSKVGSASVEIPFGNRTHAARLAVACPSPPHWRIYDGVIQRSRHGKGKI